MAERPLTYTITYQVEVGSPQKATAARDKCSAYLEEMDGVDVRLTSMGRLMPDWHVVGVDTASKQPFAETVEAVDEAEAQQKTETKSKVVAEVRRAT